MFTLRPFQRTAADRTHEALKCARSALIVMATGLGKTGTAATISFERQSFGRTLFLCHRDELVWQAVRTYSGIFGTRPDVQMGDERGDIFTASAPVVVSTVQTQYSGYSGRGRKSIFDPMDFGTVVCDEAHRYVSPKYHEVVRYYQQNPGCAVVGLTATPDRHDKLAMGRLFETVACNYDIRFGVDHSWLVPIDQYTGRLTDLNLADVGARGGDLDPRELTEVVCRTGNLHGVVEHAVKQADGRRALVFAVPGATEVGDDGRNKVKHAHLLTTLFNKAVPPKGGIAQAHYVHEKTPKADRRALLKAFRSGAFQFLVNVGVFTEGFDDPGVECVVVARPTTSRSLYTQMIGRATRPLSECVDPYPGDDQQDDRRVSIAESSKSHCQIIDFEGNAGRHKLISGADILGGDYETEVIAKAKKLSADRDGAKDLRELLEDARRAVERERQEAADRLAAVRVTSDCLWENVDPFTRAGQRAPKDPRTAGVATGKKAGPPTAGQITFLSRHAPKGTRIEDMNMGEAGAMVGEIKRRFKNRLCSLAQSNLLKKHDLPGDVPRDTAKQWLDRIAGNRWSVPPDVRHAAEEFRAVKS